MATILNAADIEFMRNTRKEIVENRETLITIAYKSAITEDEVTGEKTGGETVTRDVMSVVTEISTSSRMVENALIGGIAVEKGDIVLSISYELIADITVKLTSVNYDDKEYSVMASDKKGIGKPNRVEVLGRLIT